MNTILIQNGNRWADFGRRMRWAACLAIVSYALSGSMALQAQWQTQTLNLTAGWNSVYLHVDATHTTIESMRAEVGEPVFSDVEKIYLWAPPTSSAQFVQSPQQPTTSGSDWMFWDGTGVGETLDRFIGNAAYLIKVADDSTGVTWDIVGKPVPPRYTWTSSGQNFVGFPTTDVGGGFPDFDAFLAEAPDLFDAVSVFYYDGSDVPVVLGALDDLTVDRGVAYWLKADDVYNRYFGSFSLTLQDSDGMEFGSSLSTYRVKVTNHTDETLTVSFGWHSDETATPSDQTAIVGLPPIVTRGTLVTATLTYPANALVEGVPDEVILDPVGELGDSQEIVFGVDRSQMPSDGLYAGVIRFTDETKQFTSIDVPVSVESSSLAGLWIGEVHIDSVSDDVPIFEMETDDNGDQQVVYDENDSPVYDLDFYEYTIDADGDGNTDLDDEGEILRTLIRDDDGRVIRAYYEFETVADELALVLNSDGTPVFDFSYYVVENDEIVRDGLKPVYADTVATTADDVRPFTMRLIVHADADGNAHLLQRIHYGYHYVFDATIGENGEDVLTPMLATQESFLDAEFLSASRRISTVHLPWTEANDPWALAGTFGEGTINTGSTGVEVGVDEHESNPFLHTYHPDHDNLDAEFASGILGTGDESYQINRVISLSFGTTGDDFGALTSSAKTVSGTYAETLALTAKDDVVKSYRLLGPFELNRISEIDALTTSVVD